MYQVGLFAINVDNLGLTTYILILTIRFPQSTQIEIICQTN